MLFVMYQYLYDAVYLYLKIVNKTISLGGNYQDGTLIQKNAKGMHFDGKELPSQCPVLLRNEVCFICRHFQLL